MNEIYEKVYKSISVEMEAELILRLGELAKREGKAFGEYVRAVLREHVERVESTGR